MGGLLIAALNMTAALLVILECQLSQRLLNASLGFAAGVMLYPVVSLA